MYEAAQASGNARGKSDGKKSAEKKGLFARIIGFFKEVLVELKKVKTPTRQELWQMFWTVTFFVLIVMVFVGLVDLVFGQAMFWIFG